MLLRRTCALLLTVAAALPALDLTDGLMYAVPTPSGHAPTVDGDLGDWDLSGAEPAWLALDSAARQNATFALMYDDEALYVSARVTLGGRAMRNESNPIDAFWRGDLVHFRFAADQAPDDGSSDRVVHASLWKNTDTNHDWLQVQYGRKLDKGSAVAPEGSAVAIRVQGDAAYVLEARIPWSVAHVPGGRNPFKPGQRMNGIFEVVWQGGDSGRCAAVYRKNPGTLAFLHPDDWGQVEFSAHGDLPKRHPTLDESIEAMRREGPAEIGAPITVAIPEDGFKLTVNILGARGEVIREIVGGEPRPRGEAVVRWDGLDQWGAAMPPGDYRWGAYLSRGVGVEYMGSVGRTGSPAYEDGATGGWGGDHSDPCDVAVDANGWYFLWPVAEGGRALVKTDTGGAVRWRKTPFVGGGFGPFHAVASDGVHVYLTLGDTQPKLVRLSAATGQTLTWGDGPDAQPDLDLRGGGGGGKNHAVDSPIGSQPEAVGVAAGGGEVFVSLYSKDLIRVVSGETGASIRDLHCPSPRGVALRGRDLYAVSYPAAGPGRVLVFRGGAGDGVPLVTSGLEAPWDVTVDPAGTIYVSDLGASQQVKLFGPDGAARGAWGKPGGRPWAGVYDATSFLHPAGLAADSAGGVLIAESAIPKICSRWDARAGRQLRHWFGEPTYWTGTWPDPRDPWRAFYQTNGGFARVRIPAPGSAGLLEAYWNLPAAGFPAAGDFSIVIPEVDIAANGRTYLIGDCSPNGICLVDGDRILPVGSLRVRNEDVNRLELWSDANGDHLEQPDEVSRIEQIEGKPLTPSANFLVHSFHMRADGELYLENASNRILAIPATGFRPDGSIAWDASKARWAVPSIVPSLDGSGPYTGPRGQCGIETDTRGAIYTCFSAAMPHRTPEFDARMRQRFPDLEPWDWGAFADEAIAKRNMEGIGHSGEMNAVKIAKYDAQGRPLWLVGRKARSSAKMGEMYHHWALAGLIGDDYVVVASEWGPFTIYTADGYFVDSFMADPGQSPPPGPFTFGGETGAGRVRAFPERDEVWAYSVGLAYRLTGFARGRLDGERRVDGTVHLDQAIAAADATAPAAKPLRLVKVGADPIADAAAWKPVPATDVKHDGSALAEVQLAYDDANLYARLHVHDATPLVNGADALNIAFKGGDTAGIVLGAQAHDEPAAGDIRLLAAMIGKQPKLIAMKSQTALAEHADEYATPAGGRVRFAFVGEVPGGRVTLVPDADGAGYTAAFAVPRAFLELPIAAGSSLRGDVEIRLGGQGQRGLQTTTRAYLFTPKRSETTMVDDVPTESRLYPRFWGEVRIE